MILRKSDEAMASSASIVATATCISVLLGVNKLHHPKT